MLSYVIKYILPVFLFLNCYNLKSQVFKVDTTHQPKELIEKYFLSKNHDGIKIRNVKYSGVKKALGIFSYISNLQDLPPCGIVLSSGNVLDALGPNDFTASTENYCFGDMDLQSVVNSKTFDAAIIEFDFISLTDSINFVFQFASEEYPEYVKKGVSDIFGFFVINKQTGIKKNIALLTGKNTPITIDLINGETNPEFYISNNHSDYKYNENDRLRDYQFHENNYLFQFDGYTIPIISGIKLKAYNWYHFKIAIADVGDRKFDSWIFLKGNSFISTGKKISPAKEELKNYFQYLITDSLAINSINNKINIIAPIYFDFNSSIIKKSSFKLLNYLTGLIKYTDYSLTINGYADETGNEKYNLKLSQERADSVKLHLIEKGIDQNRLKALGKGEIISSEELDKSRKVEFVLY